MNVAVISNNDVHVETLIFIYFALASIPNVKPVVFPLRGDRKGLKSLLEQENIQHAFLTHDIDRNFDVGVILTAYPKGIEMASIPMENHPFIKAFSDRKILITHRTNAPVSHYPSDKLICLSPLGEKFGIPHLYPCENPILGDEMYPATSTLRLLVQGKFTYRHRDFSLIRMMLDRFHTGIHIILIGIGSGNLGFGDPRISAYDNLNEIEFYQMSSTCHYVLPLVDHHTLNGTYVRERFSSSLGIAFADLKPSIVHESIQKIYPFWIGYSYKDEAGLLALLDRLIDNHMEYSNARELMRKNRTFMRSHNQRVLTDVLKTMASGRRLPCAHS